MVLSHQLPSGLEAPIAFFSHTLSSPERNYSQLDREALAIVGGVKRFHAYLYGCHMGIIAGDRQISQVHLLDCFPGTYNYTLHHRPGKHICHADALSRCPLPIAIEDPAPASTVLLIDNMQLPITAADVAKHTG